MYRVQAYVLKRNREKLRETKRLTNINRILAKF